MKDVIFSQINANELIEQIAQRTAEIISSHKNNNSTTEVKESFLSIEEAASFLKISIHTIYSKVSRKEIPSMKRNGRLYFSSKDLTEYIKSGRKLTNDEVDAAADKYLAKK